MKTITLSHALKHKNRLAGEVARLREIVQRENSRKESQPVRADVRAAFDENVTRSRELAAFKGAIAAANAGVTGPARGIYGKLNLQAELRGLLAFVKALNTKEGEEAAPIGFRGDTFRQTYIAVITRDEVDRLAAAYQTEIERLQDEIDEFNATTRIPLAA